MKMAFSSILVVLTFSLPALAEIQGSGQRRGDDPVMKEQGTSYNEVLGIMKMDPYDINHLPIQPITLFKNIGQGLIPSFNVAKRSHEILDEKKDYRTVGEPKPIHPMGVGLEGVLNMKPTRWSGAFAGGTFRVLARASISQGNPFMHDPKTGKPQTRTSALALKIFPSGSLDAPQKTAHVVLNNDLNGLLDPKGQPMNWTAVSMTNQPTFQVTKIRKLYEVLTLMGVAYGSLTSHLDRIQKAPYINPLLRPVHGLSEMGVKDPAQVHTPIWIMFSPSPSLETVPADDFRLEIVKTLERNQGLEYDVYVCDTLDQNGERIWERVGNLHLQNPLLTRGVDQNLLFPHDSLKSSMTGQALQMPVVSPKRIPRHGEIH